MAGGTKAHKIIKIMSAALGEGSDVVYLLSGRDLAVLFALFTQRVGRNVAVTDSLPGAAVAFLGGGVALVFFIVFVFLLLMLRAEPGGGQLGTAGMGAGCLGFVRHLNHLLGKAKAPGECVSKGFCGLHSF